ncbi:MAG: bifunctional methylenetetrahydrofolate dehydrogenase/methenyltetrahydrofolate cyclohydrolase FolD [bacterium]|nr:bifunctional methylenetetrahydrofolate dehydrogenase/methenyltetrahydrofolate cyclohydrolase FolD [bacterium]
MSQKTSATILKGKPVAAEVMEELRATIEDGTRRIGRPPGLAVILVGENPASQIYVRNKERAAENLGIRTYDYRLPADTTQEHVLGLITRLNTDPAVHGILIQLPLPSHLHEEELLHAVNPEKDVDVFHPDNFGKLALNVGNLRPCTPAGVIELLKRNGVEMDGKNVAIVGASKIVGLPLSLLFLYEGATVSLCHVKTRDVTALTKQADIVVAALGVPRFLKRDMVREGAVVVDVGINRLEDGKLVGDCDFEGLQDWVSAITPVPGGVGPMTVAMLMVNTVRAYRVQVLGELPSQHLRMLE